MFTNSDYRIPSYFLIFYHWKFPFGIGRGAGQITNGHTHGSNGNSIYYYRYKNKIDISNQTQFTKLFLKIIIFIYFCQLKLDNIMPHKRLYTTTIKVLPLVFRYISENYVCKQNAFDVFNTPLYYLISSGLSRSNIAIPSRISAKYQSYVPIRIHITEWDFYHYGWEMTPLQQIRLSNIVKSQIIREICEKAMVLHCYTHIPREAAIRELMSQNYFEEEELSLASVKKHYQRHFLKQEEKLIENIYYLKNLKNT